MNMKEILAKYNATQDIELMNEFMDEAGCQPHDIYAYLEDWYKAKSEYLLKLFGDKLTVDCGTIEFTKSFYEIEEEMYADSELCTLRNQFNQAISDLIRKTLTLNPEAEYYWLKYVDDDSEYYADMLSNCTSFYHLYTNGVDYITKRKAKFANKPDECVCVHNKQKLTKVYDTFFKTIENVFPGEFKTELAEARRLKSAVMTRVAMYKGRCRTTGKLSLSIHPFDYITMSQNTCGWDSCMVLNDEYGDKGDYCLGTVATMNSRNAVIAYLDSDKLYYPCNYGKFREVTWNNKKYRNIFVVDPAIISGVRGYPCKNFDIDDIILNKLMELAHNNLGWDYKDSIKEGEERHIDGALMYFETSKMYNDASHHPCHYVEGCHNETNQKTYAQKCGHSKANYALKYDGEAYCAFCGKLMTEADGNHPVCFECNGIYMCHHCGDRVDEDCVEWIDGNPYCEYCATENFHDCCECGQRVESTYSAEGEPANTWIRAIMERTDWEESVKRYKEACEKYQKDIAEAEAERVWRYIPCPTRPNRFEEFTVGFMCEDCLDEAIKEGYVKYARFAARPMSERYMCEYFFITQKGLEDEEFCEKFDFWFRRDDYHRISLEEYQAKFPDTEELEYPSER